MKLNIIEKRNLQDSYYPAKNNYDDKPADKFYKLDDSLLNDFQDEDVAVISQKFLKKIDYYESAKKSINETLKSKKLSLREWRVLNEVVISKTSGPKIIRSHTNYTYPQISNILNMLESKGLINRNYFVPKDRRTVQISITASGKEAWKLGIQNIIDFEHNGV